jgi:hypothetical protein
MGINHLQLSAELIAALYPESLVKSLHPDTGKIPSNPLLQVQTEKRDYPFLGKNLGSICFLVSSPEDEFIPNEQLLFLKKILVACRCSLDDIALINAKRHPINLETLKEQFHPGILFLWGVTPSSIGIEKDLPDMSITTTENIRVIPVLQADRMSMDNSEGVELKRTLWITLKKLFNL